MSEAGFEPANSLREGLKPPAFDRLATPTHNPKHIPEVYVDSGEVVRRVGFEPTLSRL